MAGSYEIPSPCGGGLGWGRLPDAGKVADTRDFTLTPTLSLKGEGELKKPAESGKSRFRQKYSAHNLRTENHGDATNVSIPRRPGPLRRLRRQVHSRNADGGGGRTGTSLQQRKVRRGLSGPPDPPADQLRRPAHAALLRREPVAPPGRCEDIPEAGRPGPHRRPQDKQRPRPGAPRSAHGQAAHHRRDRRWAARRRHRHRLRHAGLAVHRLHGRGRHPSSVPQRLPYALAGGRGHQRRVRHPDAERRHQRGHPRLGHQCRDHSLPHRQRGRPPPLPS